MTHVAITRLDAASTTVSAHDLFEKMELIVLKAKANLPRN